MLLLDGQPADDDLLLTDRGLAYGDGLFETVAVRDGRLLAWDAHLERLARGCDVLGLPAPSTRLLSAEAEALAGDVARGVLKLMLTRGSGGRGYRPPPKPTPRRIMALNPWPADLPEDTSTAVATFICRHPLGIAPALAGIKHLNRLDQVLASAEWPGPEFFEGLMLDLEGNLIEGTRSNVFLLKGDRLATPDLTWCGVAGVVRGAVLRTARGLGLRVAEQRLEPAALGAADEVFISNSIIGLRSVGRVVGEDSEIEFGAGGLCQELATALRAADVIP